MKERHPRRFGGDGTAWRMVGHIVPQTAPLRLAVALLVPIAVAMSACGGSGASGPASAGTQEPPALGYRVVHTFPHDPQAFTEGLAIDGGRLYESTGAFTQPSSLREVDLTTGAVRRHLDLAPAFFAEGLTIDGGRAIQLTWRSHVGFVYDAATFRLIGTFPYPTEGWGLATDGRSLIMSDGTDTLRFLDPTTFQVRRSVRVTRHGRPVAAINELEYVRGVILANVFQSTTVLRIDPASGAVTGTLDLSALSPHPPSPEAVLNGIAYDPIADRLYVTGKLWPRLVEIRLSGG